MSTLNNGLYKLKNSLEIQSIARDIDMMGLYCHFCLNCEIEDRIIFFGGQEIRLEKGSVLYSQLKYSEIFRKSIGKINKMIKALEKMGIGENKNTNKFSIFKLKDPFILWQVGKQNESELKAEGNTYNKDLKYNNNNYNNILYIGEIEKYFLDRTGIKQSLDGLPDDITFESFKRSFDNYLKIRNSKLTFYNYHFTLRQFINSPKGYKKFLGANFEDFIDGRKMGEYEMDKTHKKRAEMKRKEDETMKEELRKKKHHEEWLKGVLEKMPEPEKAEIWKEAEEKASGFKIKGERYIRIMFNRLITEKFKYDSTIYNGNAESSN